MKKIILFTFLISLINQGFSQEQVDKLNYPSGIYKTKSDFINKKPSSNIELKTKEIELIINNDSIIERCYFYDKHRGKKIRKVFAVSHKGFLYFRNGTILKHKNKKDKFMSGSKNEFTLVRLGGKNFLYAEAGLINHWKIGLSAGVSSGVGEIIGNELGRSIQKSYPESTKYGKGVIWDYKKKEFNIIRDCNDYNEFLENSTLEKINCGNKKFDLRKIRVDIETIK
jgi:hypothetical protein